MSGEDIAAVIKENKKTNKQKNKWLWGLPVEEATAGVKWTVYRSAMTRVEYSHIRKY